MTVSEMKARRTEYQAVLRARQDALAAERGLTDSSSDADWDAVAEIVAEMPERAEVTRLTVEITAAEAREENSRIAARKSTPPKHCPKCGHIVTALGRCDDCDDWDN